MLSSILDSFRDFFSNLLFKLGLTTKNATVILLGLDNAGKTTLLYKLKRGSVKPFTPTQRANVEELTVGALSFKAWDLGGHRQVRHLWRQYCSEADAIVFMVDSADPDRFAEARTELLGLFQPISGDDDGGNADVITAPVAIIANKIDLESAVPRDRLSQALGISEIRPGARIQIFPCSLFRGVGYEQAFAWIAEQI